MIGSVALSPLQTGSSAASMNALRGLPARPTLDTAVQDFESMFMTQMLQPMFETVDVDDTFGGGHAEQIMRSFMVQEYGKTMAKHLPESFTRALRDDIARKQSPDAQHAMDIVS